MNVSNKIKKLFEMKCKQESIDEDFFVDIEKEISANLSDTWSRFILSFDYQNYIHYQKILQQTSLHHKNSIL